MASQTSILTLVVASILAANAASSQSQVGDSIDQPIPDAKPRGLNTPEVVLQLKYDKGALDRIYLAQFRQNDAVWNPSVPARTNLCSDLCHAGLGGDGCGASCQDLVPVGLQSALREGEGSNSTDLMGEPRTAVCPTLCENNLGQPLCSCQEPRARVSPNWGDVCSAFCHSDRFVLGGCPTCEASTTPHAEEMITMYNQYNRLLSTSDGWSAWCNVQCRQGQGGAACNCDRGPFQ